jgi:hypothetical protein
MKMAQPKPDRGSHCDLADQVEPAGEPTPPKLFDKTVTGYERERMFERG